MIIIATQQTRGGALFIMKLLIVDDEELTRNGLISSIDWEHFGITEILQADDGLNGLNAAKEHRPDIILCDVRDAAHGRH